MTEIAGPARSGQGLSLEIRSPELAQPLRTIRGARWPMASAGRGPESEAPMWFRLFRTRQWVASVLGLKRKRTPFCKRPERLHARPRLEALEDRLVPATA